MKRETINNMGDSKRLNGVVGVVTPRRGRFISLTITIRAFHLTRIPPHKPEKKAKQNEICRKELSLHRPKTEGDDRKRSLKNLSRHRLNKRSAKSDNKFHVCTRGRNPLAGSLNFGTSH